MRRLGVRIVSRKAIREATEKHPEWGASLNAWYKITKNADWKSFADVRNSWENSDVVGPFVVFDISHNKCRLIATIKYKWRMVYVRDILTHAEYDNMEWQK
jgi:mRNA interferase HigB